MTWTELSGHGTLYAYTTMRVVPTVCKAEVPYRVCVFELDEGFRLVTRLPGTEPATLDHPVQLVAVRYTDCVSYAAKLAGGRKR